MNTGFTASAQWPSRTLADCGVLGFRALGFAEPRNDDGEHDLDALSGDGGEVPVASDEDPAFGDAARDQRGFGLARRGDRGVVARGA